MGSDDPLVPVINGRVLAQLIPNAKLRLIDDGHLFMVTRPKETAAMIEEFLALGSVSPERRSCLPMVNRMRRLFPRREGPHQST
jgi:hypothetical protein